MPIDNLQLPSWRFIFLSHEVFIMMDGLMQIVELEPNGLLDSNFLQSGAVRMRVD